MLVFRSSGKQESVDGTEIASESKQEFWNVTDGEEELRSFAVSYDSRPCHIGGPWKRPRDALTCDRRARSLFGLQT